MSIEVPPGGFRCPFEVRGSAEGTILEIPLDSDRSQRLQQIRKGLKTFFDSPQSPGIKFVLPFAKLERCLSPQALKDAIQPYLCEFLAVELDMKLDGFLQQRELPDFSTTGEDTPEKKRELTIYYLREKILETGHAFPKNIAELADWIGTAFQEKTFSGVSRNSVTIFDGRFPIAGKILLSMMPGLFTRMGADQPNPDPRTTKDLFSFVKSPVYPKTFGRYSPHVEVVFTRHADIASLTKEQAVGIRRRSNEVNQAAGIRVQSIESDQLPPGVWVPKEDFIGSTT